VRRSRCAAARVTWYRSRTGVRRVVVFRSPCRAPWYAGKATMAAKWSTNGNETAVPLVGRGRPFLLGSTGGESLLKVERTGIEPATPCLQTWNRGSGNSTSIRGRLISNRAGISNSSLVNPKSPCSSSTSPTKVRTSLERVWAKRSRGSSRWRPSRFPASWVPPDARLLWLTEEKSEPGPDVPAGRQPAAREESFVPMLSVMDPRLIQLLALGVPRSPPRCPLACRPVRSRGVPSTSRTEDDPASD
jgi:hypothetical protein